MKTRIAQAALATLLALGIQSTSFGFMSIAPQPGQKQMTITQRVDALREEVTLGETDCSEMLEKLNTVLEDIDDKLDAGAENEDELLVARDEIVKMRYDLECLAEDLTQVDSNRSAGGGVTNLSPSAGGGIGVSGSAGGGGVASSGSLGGSLGGLGALGALGGVAATVASNSDDPGTILSGSTTN